jgi:hypothetical protein
VLFALTLLLAVRLLFIAFHWRNLEQLWYDYERKGLIYRIAWLIDIATGLIYFGLVLRFLYYFASIDNPLPDMFLSTLGLSILSRLMIHRFPRTNSPGAYSDAKVDLLVHIVMSLLTAVGVTLLTAVYLWFAAI